MELTERQRWMSALAEAVVEGGLSSSQEAEVLAWVNGYDQDDPAASVLDAEFYNNAVKRRVVWLHSRLRQSGRAE